MKRSNRKRFSTKRFQTRVLVLAFSTLTVSVLGAVEASRASPSLGPLGPHANTSGPLPPSFIENVGQFEEKVRFYLRDGEQSVRVGRGEVILSAPASRPGNGRFGDGGGAMVHIHFVESDPAVVVEGLDPLPGVANFYHGNDPSRWRTDVPTFAAVAQRGLYPGITQIYRGAEGQVKSEFEVAPGADPARIRMQYSGAESLAIGDRGELIVRTLAGEWRESAPEAYQQIGSGRHVVASRFQLLGPSQVGFALGAYDRDHPLVIDPVLFFSTYLGGTSADSGSGIAVDRDGNTLVIGTTTSTDFPVMNAELDANSGGNDIFVSKLNASGSGLLYSTYLGGAGREFGIDIAVDPAGNAYGVGWTNSTNFPTRFPFQSMFAGFDDAAVFKLDASGQLVYSTYLGGNGDDQPEDIAVDSAGQAFILGNTNASTFPTTPWAFSTIVQGSWDAFLTKFDAAGSTLIYSTFFGGSGFEEPKGLAVDDLGNAYAVGRSQSSDFPLQVDPAASSVYDAVYNGLDTAFLTKLSPDGHSLVYSTFLDGISPRFGSSKLDVAVDSTYHAYVVAPTQDNASFPPTPLAFDPMFDGPIDAVIMKVETDGSDLVYSTFLGDLGEDRPNAIAVDGGGSAHITGSTTSPDFPLADPISTILGGSRDIFVARLSPDGTQLPFGTFLGGSGSDTANGIALGPGGPCLTGSTASTDFPTGAPQALAPFQGSFAGGVADAFAACIDTDCLTPPPDMVYWAPFDESFGTTAADLVAGNNGNHLGLASPASGKVSGAIDLGDGHVEVPHSSDLDFGVGSFSIDFWIQEPDYPPLGGVVAKHDNVLNQGFEVHWDICTCIPSFASLFLTLNGVSHSLPNFSVPQNAPLPWTHFVIVVDRDEQLIRFYVDGTLRSTEPIAIPASASVTNTEPMLVGKGVTSFSDFSGQLDELELFSRALTAIEAEALYAAGSHGKCKDSLHVPWDAELCAGEQDVVVSLELCNHSTMAESYELTFAPLPIEPGCTIPGPTVFTDAATGAVPPLAVSVPSQSCIQVPIRIERPVQMVADWDVGCYQVIRENVSTRATQIFSGSVQDVRASCFPPTPFPQEFELALANDIVVVPVGEGVALPFELGNTTPSARTVDYQIEAFASDMVSAQDAIGLDGQAPGVPIAGSVSVGPGETVDILVDVANVGTEPFANYDLVLSTSTAEQSSLVPITSTGFRHCKTWEIVVANKDKATTMMNTAVVIAVAANDFSLAGPLDLSGLTLVGGPSSGTATPNGAGSFTYVPMPGFVGGDAFSYQICETGGQCDTGVVGVVVQPPEVIFGDGFESGDASAWSAIVP